MHQKIKTDVSLVCDMLSYSPAYQAKLFSIRLTMQKKDKFNVTISKEALR